MAHGYPILLDLRGRLVVIVGGGAVAVRKAKGVLGAGAERVRCIAPEIDADMPKEVERVIGRFEERHLEGAGLVFAATNREEVNEAVVMEARRRGIWVNRADDGSTDFTVPAILEDGPMLVAVWAGGNPAMAARVRDEITQRVIVVSFARMAEVMSGLRPVLKQVMSEKRRREAFRLLASEQALEVLERRGEEGVWDWLVERFDELANRKSQHPPRRPADGGGP